MIFRFSWRNHRHSAARTIPAQPSEILIGIVRRSAGGISPVKAESSDCDCAVGLHSFTLANTQRHPPKRGAFRGLVRSSDSPLRLDSE
jgi:hypothetical protein